MSDSFFLPLGDGRWRATEHTVGPWDPGAQHAGPPAALLARAVERCEPRDDTVVVRVACDVLGSVPVGDLAVRARVLRPGRSVELLEAELVPEGDARPSVRMQAWRVRRAPDHVPPTVHAGTPPALPEPTGHAWSAALNSGGYLAAVEWRTVPPVVPEPGAATVWTRLLHPLVPGEEPTGLQRVLAVADSGNGASAYLDPARWLFINPELTVHVHREAVGEWVCLDAVTTVSPGGAGVATSVLSDREGPVAVGAQALLVAPRAPGTARPAG